MNKQQSIRLLLIIAMVLLIAAFLVLGFFTGIIVYSDILDLRSNRLSGVQAGKDILIVLVWLAIIPGFVYLRKKYKNSK